MGFEVHWEEAPDWRLVQRDSVRIMLGRCPNDVPAFEVGSHNYFGYLEVDDVDALHDELTGRGANCTSPKNATYGMREIVVTTIDGHRIVFCARKRSVLIASRRAVSTQNASRPCGNSA